MPPIPISIHVYPTLRKNCDAALVTAFHERNWPIVINLAKQRYKSTKDPYYQVGASRLYSDIYSYIHISKVHMYTRLDEKASSKRIYNRLGVDKEIRYRPLHHTPFLRVNSISLLSPV